ncbi:MULTISPECIES: hypothetical protein [unclassified Curtobacterium]|nr:MULTISPECIES: hypothetical protein [unclassified Curtobacterium]WIB12486.1 hypothetical protein DEJ36_17925 [Curtobacterium sp. MCPF17_052]
MLGPRGTLTTGIAAAAVLATAHGVYQERRYARVLVLLQRDAGAVVP